MSVRVLDAGFDREAFLGLADVEAFISWLVTNLPSLQVHLKVRSSPFVPGGIDAQVTGIEAVQACYRWSGDWATVGQLLAIYRENIRAAVRSGNQDSTYSACVDILEWGNVPSSAGYLAGLR